MAFKILCDGVLLKETYGFKPTTISSAKVCYENRLIIVKHKSAICQGKQWRWDCRCEVLGVTSSSKQLKVRGYVLRMSWIKSASRD